MDWFIINNLTEIDTPALVIYHDRLKQNIETAVQMIGDVTRLRPHVKTNKSPQVTQLLLEAGIQKFKCATIPEAEMLAQCGCPDILLAYQPVGPKQGRLLKLIKAYPKSQFSCIVDQYDIAQRLSTIAKEQDTTIQIYIDIDSGMGRTGIVPGDKALELYQQTNQLSGLATKGFHIYDGHIDNPDFEERKKACNASFQPIESMIRTLKNKNIHPRIIAGGSPTFPIHARRSTVECSPGTFVFWDKGYQEVCPEQDFVPAALVLTRVISHPKQNVVCLDLGYKSIASENPLNRRVTFLNAPELQVISQHEEHFVMNAERGHSLKIGDVLYGVPIHICPTVALYNFAYLVKDKQVQKKKWQITARNREINI